MYVSADELPASSPISPHGLCLKMAEYGERNGHNLFESHDCALDKCCLDRS